MPADMPPERVLDYASPEARNTIPFVRAMRSWRALAGWGFWLTLVGLVINPLLSVVAGFVLCVGSIGALICMVRAASAEVGIGYALRHLLLALLLMPVLFAGVFLVTRLVESDLITWRLAQRPASPG